MSSPQIEIIATCGSEELARYTLGPGSYMIGRAPECSLRIETEGISRQHARLSFSEDGSISLEDIGSANGTFLNDEPISGTVSVHPNQSIKLGAAELLIQQPIVPVGGGSLADSRSTGLPSELRTPHRYIVGEQIAKGGMGAILRAREVATRRTVAMKVMLRDKESSQTLRFIEEAQITAQLEHPNIVPVHELGVDSRGAVFYTMTLVQGITLKKILDLLEEGVDETRAKYTPSALLTIFQKVCDAVAFAHSKGVVHRDLKPANIMVGGFGEVLVMDWGLAKLIDAEAAVGEPRSADRAVAVETARRDEGDAFSTMEGSVMGTPPYMSPEQARGEVAAIDSRSDIFSLGVILYHLITLKLPFPGRSAFEILQKIILGEFAPPQDVPNSLRAVCMKALAPLPLHRYQRVEEMQADLAAYQTGFATGAEKANPGRRFWLFFRRSYHYFIAMAWGAAIVLFIGMWKWLVLFHAEKDWGDRAWIPLLIVLFIVGAMVSGVFDDASKLKKRLVRLTEAAIARSRQYVIEQNFGDAYREISLACDMVPDERRYSALKGNILQCLGRFEDAIVMYGYAGTSTKWAMVNVEVCRRVLAQRREGAPPAEYLMELEKALIAQGRNGEAEYVRTRRVSWGGSL